MATTRKPNFDIPSGAAATVKIIDTTTSIDGIKVSALMGPELPGFDVFQDIPAWSFLVESSTTGQKALFDLGVPPNWREFAPAVVHRLEEFGWKVTGKKHVSEILREQGVKLEGVGSIIWSHHHWDHLGDPSTFPSSTALVVGPGFKEAFLPGYPEKGDAPVRASDWKNRELREITFEEPGTLQIGDFRANDFFGDGSFYLLDTPGHAVGHVCGLARTTSDPDTFILMGGDLCHHGGEIRPSEYVPLPESISPHPFTGSVASPCPGHVFKPIHTTRDRDPKKPFFEPTMGLSIPEAIRSIEKAQKADARENVLFIYAHDANIRDVVDFFPKDANRWMEQGWREKLFWKFLGDFERSVKEEA